MTHRQAQSGFSLVELAIVVAITLIVTAMAIPKFVTMVRSLRVAGDARSIAGVIGQAKMRAAADFTQARAYVDSATNTYRLDVWNKAFNCWIPDGAPTPVSAANCVTPGVPGPTAILLSPGVTLGFGGMGAPPPNTTPALAQGPPCRNDVGVPIPGVGAPIANTSCVVFNSRGIPVDNTGTPTVNDAIYVTDLNNVYGVTIDIGGLVKTWRGDPSGQSASPWHQR